MKTKTRHGMLLATATAAGLCLSSTVQAAELQLDINAIVAQAYAGSNGSGGTSAFGGAWTGIAGQGHSGSLVLSVGGSSALAGVLIDGVAQTITGWSLSSFSGTINLVDGVVTGGGFAVTVTDGSVFDSYTASIVSNSGTVSGGGVPPVSPPFEIKGLTFAGTFSGSTFAGVDVSQWFNYNGILPGNFVNFAYDPDSTGLDSNANIDIFVAIPLPSAGLMGLAGMGLVAVRRRR